MWPGPRGDVFRRDAHSVRRVVCARMEIMVAGFWQQVLDSDMAVPDERPLNELTAELVGMLGSTNPVERDEIAYPVLATWVAEGVYDDLLVTFGDSLAERPAAGLGNHDDDTVFRRSSCARVLTECVRRDNVAHVLPARRRRQLGRPGDRLVRPRAGPPRLGRRQGLGARRRLRRRPDRRAGAVAPPRPGAPRRSCSTCSPSGCWRRAPGS